MEDTDVTEFDQIIGGIEDIAISDDFQALQNNLLETYCHHFEVLVLIWQDLCALVLVLWSTRIIEFGILISDSQDWGSSKKIFNQKLVNPELSKSRNSWKMQSMYFDNLKFFIEENPIFTDIHHPRWKPFV